MKKLLGIILFSFIVLLLWGANVKAATFKITASKPQVKPNETFSVSVGGDCIGRVNLSVTNGTLSSSSVWVEQNYQKVNVKAGSSGTVTIIATPAVGFSDADANEYKPGSRSVKVTIVNASNSSTPSKKPTTSQGTSTSKNPTTSNSKNNVTSTSKNPTTSNSKNNVTSTSKNPATSSSKNNTTSTSKNNTTSSSKNNATNSSSNNTTNTLENNVTNNLNNNTIDNSNNTIQNTQTEANEEVQNVVKNEESLQASTDITIDYNQYQKLIKEVKHKQIIIYFLSALLAVSIICIIWLYIELRKEKLNEKVH